MNEHNSNNFSEEDDDDIDGNCIGNSVGNSIDFVNESHDDHQKDATNDNNDASDSFAKLDPNTVLDAMHDAGYACDGRLLALNSYENRVYQLGIDDGLPLVVKFYRPNRWTDAQIVEEHTFVNELVKAEIPAVPALFNTLGAQLQTYQDFRFAVFPSQGGRAPELDRADTLEQLGRFIGRIHTVGASSAFQHRPVITPDTFGQQSLDYLLTHQCIPQDILSAYTASANMMLDGVKTCYDKAGQVPVIRLHGDCHMGNVLWTDSVANGKAAGPHFVDFDDSRMGPAIQDLWMLLSGSRADMTAQLCDIVAGYEDFYEFQPKQLHLIEALRSLRLIHYSAWLAQRWSDPAFKQAFPWFNTQRYWQDRILEMREQIALMDEPVLKI
jgi:Ser/Thr protein kinase RdoA (MazF antagonist)